MPIVISDNLHFTQKLKWLIFLKLYSVLIVKKANTVVGNIESNDLFLTRLHSSRIGTARYSGRQ